MSSPTVPSAAPIDDVVSVEKNSATAATPSMQMITYASARAVRTAISLLGEGRCR